MTSHDPRREWREGWPVVAGAALGLGTALPVYGYVASLFVTELTGEFGWTRGQMATATAMVLFGSFTAPVMGRLADRFGTRPVLVAGLAAYAAIFAALALQDGSLSTFTVLIVLHTAIGLACGGAIFSRAVAGWFERSRGLALGITMTGVPLAAAILSPALQWVISGFGWRAGYGALAFLAVGVGIPIVLMLVRDRPMSDEQTGNAQEWGAVLRSKGFWLLFVALFPVNAAGTGLMSQMAPLLTDGGLSKEMAALMLSVFAGAIIVARLGAGFAMDRFPSHLVAAAVTGIPAFGCLVLAWSLAGPAWAALALILIGVQQGAEIDLIGYMVARMFGLAHYAAAYGICVLGLGISGSIGTYAFGQLFDAYGNYDVALLLSFGAYMLSAAMLYAMRFVVREEPKRAPA